MTIKYDFHIHSCLSPCADDDMTPVNIVAFASLGGLDAIAIADHNAIENVEVAIKAGEAFGVTVVPALELQTSEEIHIVCMFESFSDLKAFRDSINLIRVPNNSKVFGNQLIVDEDDNIIDTLPDLLLMNTDIGSYGVLERVKEYNGICFPAHIDREANGMLSILSIVPDDFGLVEMSYTAGETIRREYEERRFVLTDSDAHTLKDIGTGHLLEVESNTAEGIIRALRQYMDMPTVKEDKR